MDSYTPSCGSSASGPSQHSHFPLGLLPHPPASLLPLSVLYILPEPVLPGLEELRYWVVDSQLVFHLPADVVSVLVLGHLGGYLHYLRPGFVIRDIVGSASSYQALVGAC